VICFVERNNSKYLEAIAAPSLPPGNLQAVIWTHAVRSASKAVLDGGEGDLRVKSHLYGSNLEVMADLPMMAKWLARLSLVVLASRCSSTTVGENPGTDAGVAGSAGSAGASGEAGAAGRPSFPAPDPQCGDCYVVNASVAVASPSDIFISGYTDLDGSFIRRFDGEQWTTLLTWEDFGGLRELWGSSQSGLYGLVADHADPAGSPGTVHHFDVATGELNGLQARGFALWANAADEVFAMDGTGVRRFNGSEWQDLGLGSHDLLDISGSSPDNVFVLRADGGLHQYDGSSWSTPEGMNKELKALWVGSSTEVHAIAGDDHGDGITGPGFIARHDGTAWAIVQDAPDDALLAITGRPGTVYACGASRGEGGEARAVVWRGEGGSWNRFLLEDVRAFLWDADCAPSGECYAVGTDNTVLALDALQ
jgi:hypothetical protein